MQQHLLEVIEITKPPRQSVDKRYWTVNVTVKVHGHTYETAIIKATEAEIKAVNVGYTFYG